MIMGLFVLFVCTAVNLYEDAPTWGTEVFKTRIASHGSPEQRAAMFDEKQLHCPPSVLPLVRRCAGVFIWQQVGRIGVPPLCGGHALT